MKPIFPLRALLLVLYGCAGLALGYPTGASGADAPPQVTQDGLQLKVHTKQRLAYVKPGATFNQYDKMMILDCYVEFQKGWQQSYNASVADPSRQVTDRDIQRKKTTAAAEFKKVFTAELQKGGYQVTDTAGPDVLLLRPAIINLQVTAPYIQSPGIDANFISSAGAATLYLALWDSSTSTLLARVMDAQADPENFARPANPVTNMQAADLVLRNWADDLVRHLDAVHGKGAGK